MVLSVHHTFCALVTGALIGVVLILSCRALRTPVWQTDLLAVMSVTARRLFFNFIQSLGGGTGVSAVL